MGRAEQLVRAAKARAQITAFLASQEQPATPDIILSGAVSDLDYKVTDLSNFLGRMADQKLITKVEVDHLDYKYGYTSNDALPAEVEPEASPTTKKKSKEVPIDIRVNERNKSISIRYAGLLITLSKED